MNIIGRYLPAAVLAGICIFSAPYTTSGYILASSSELSLALTDVQSGISDVSTLFLDDLFSVNVDGLEWEGTNDQESITLVYFTTKINGEVVAEGTYEIPEDPFELPSSITAGEVSVSTVGSNDIEVILSNTLDESTASASLSLQSMRPWSSLVPIVIVLIFAVRTGDVGFSLLAGIFVAACMVSGNIKSGFRSTLDTYILDALSDHYHGYVYLFAFILSGLVTMMQKSGGIAGLTRRFGQLATSHTKAQLSAYFAGWMIFFDDYANALVVGEAMTPLMDAFNTSREKIAFIVDATAAPVASIIPLSSWIGFEAGLIQTEIDKIIERRGGTDDLSITTSGFGAFLETVRYRYYPFFMLMLIPILALTSRECGPMLIAERKTRVYKRTDGGDGRHHVSSKGDHNDAAPNEDTPHRAYNTFVPLVFLIFFLLYFLVKTGSDGSGEQTVLDKIKLADSYSALLWGGAATVLISQVFYAFQFKKDGQIVVPSGSDLRREFFRSSEESDEDTNEAKVLMSATEGSEAFMIGMIQIFPALAVLTLAWASGAAIVAVGADRLFSHLITSGIEPEMLPTICFLVSGLLALSTGTSWGTMTIVFPLVAVPTFEASGEDPDIFYATIAGILSGAVAGDHVSPISDTTILSSLATNCDLLAHVQTQAPYVLWMSLFSICVGTLPVGFSAYPNIVAYVLGAILIGLFVFLVCQKVIDKEGRFDVFTELYLRGMGNKELLQLKQDTKDEYARQEQETEGLLEDSSDKKVVDNEGEENEGEEAEKVDSKKVDPNEDNSEEVETEEVGQGEIEKAKSEDTLHA